jgi:hypothetical protein
VDPGWGAGAFFAAGGGAASVVVVVVVEEALSLLGASLPDGCASLPDGCAALPDGCDVAVSPDSVVVVVVVLVALSLAAVSLGDAPSAALTGAPTERPPPARAEMIARHVRRRAWFKGCMPCGRSSRGSSLGCGRRRPLPPTRGTPTGIHIGKEA